MLRPEREIPTLDLYERRRFWLLMLSYCAGRLREFDEGLAQLKGAGAKTSSLIDELGPEAPTEKEIAEAQAESHTGDTCQPQEQQSADPQSPEAAIGSNVVDLPLGRE